MGIYDSEWTSCPYDASHRVPRTRIQYHLVRCQKANPQFLVCPYNATHRFLPSQMLDHCQNCPNKPLVLVRAEVPTGGNISVPKPILQREFLPETDPDHECWDD